MPRQDSSISGGLEKLVSRRPFEGLFKGRITDFEVRIAALTK